MRSLIELPGLNVSSLATTVPGHAPRVMRLMRTIGVWPMASRMLLAIHGAVQPAPRVRRSSSHAARLVCVGSVVRSAVSCGVCPSRPMQADAVERHGRVAGHERHVGGAGAIGADRGHRSERQRLADAAVEVEQRARCRRRRPSADTRRRTSACRACAASDAATTSCIDVFARSNCSLDSARRSPVTTAVAATTLSLPAAEAARFGRRRAARRCRRRSDPG